MITDYMRQEGKSVVSVRVEAPVRVMDFGGWTDTWFAQHGKVLCLSVLSRNISHPEGEYRGIEALAKVSLASGPGEFTLQAPDVDKKLSCSAGSADWNKMDLIEATISGMRTPEGINVDIIVTSPVVPKGSSVGSSASVSVVLTTLLDYLGRSEVDPGWVARTCHEVETKIMGIECGVQDQAAAAYAYGANFIDIYHYPNFFASKVALAVSTKRELESRMITVIYGGCHSSSEIHKKVITRLENTGRLASELQQMRQIPEEARYCLLSGDYTGLGRAMRENTAVQRSLHKELISPECQSLIDLCQSHGTIGEKVNGAGGPQGGSLTVLTGDVNNKKHLACIVSEQFPETLVLEHRLADTGLQINVQ